MLATAAPPCLPREGASGTLCRAGGLSGPWAVGAKGLRLVISGPREGGWHIVACVGRSTCRCWGSDCGCRPRDVLV